MTYPSKEHDSSESSKLSDSDMALLIKIIASMKVLESVEMTRMTLIMTE